MCLLSLLLGLGSPGARLGSAPGGWRVGEQRPRCVGEGSEGAARAASRTCSRPGRWRHRQSSLPGSAVRYTTAPVRSLLREPPSPPLGTKPEQTRRAAHSPRPGYGAWALPAVTPPSSSGLGWFVENPPEAPSALSEESKEQRVWGYASVRRVTGGTRAHPDATSKSHQALAGVGERKQDARSGELTVKNGPPATGCGSEKSLGVGAAGRGARTPRLALQTCPRATDGTFAKPLRVSEARVF